jgi:hypothetical protein
MILKQSRSLAKWKKDIMQKWHQVALESITYESKKEIIVGSN